MCPAVSGHAMSDPRLDHALAAVAEDGCHEARTDGRFRMKSLALIASALAACIAIPAIAETRGPICTVPCPSGKECQLVLALPQRR